MGNSCTCVGSRVSKDGVHAFWWSRADHAITYGDRESSSKHLEGRPNATDEPPGLVIVLNEKTEPTKTLRAVEEMKPAEPRLQEREDDIRPPQSTSHKEETALEQTESLNEVSHKTQFGGRKDEPIPVTNRRDIDESKTTRGRLTENRKGKLEEIALLKIHNKRIPSVGLHIESVLQTQKGYFKKFYSLGKEIGHGRYGTTFLCVEKSSGKQYACKCIAKRRLVTIEDVEDLRREIQIMHHLAGNPNIIEIKGAYEDPVAVFVVMQLCTGGELFDRIFNHGHYSERKAAQLARTILSVVQDCHSLGVFHRDLKPENFLFVNEQEDSPMKTIDFGLSEFFKPGETFSAVVGSPYYIAPEVLHKCYEPKADVWSAGVIIYILLSGVPPFWGETDEEIFQGILYGKIDFSADPWPSISESAKDLVRKLLNRDPRKRLSAQEALCHPWVQVDGVAPDTPLDSSVLSRLKHFSDMNKLKKMALRVIAERLSEEEIAGLKKMFKAIDRDNSGEITFDELRDGLKNFGANTNENEVHDLMEAADINKNGSIDYREFIAATLHVNKVEKEDLLFAAFSYFDKDGSGYITQDELQQACEEFGIEDVHLEDMIKEVDQDNDGRIDYKEFVAMMQKGNADFGKRDERNSFRIGFSEALPVF